MTLIKETQTNKLQIANNYAKSPLPPSPPAHPKLLNY